jgi:hypothetical protein
MKDFTPDAAAIKMYRAMPAGRHLSIDMARSYLTRQNVLHELRVIRDRVEDQHPANQQNNLLAVLDLLEFLATSGALNF